MADKKYNVVLTASDETRAAFDSARSNIDGFQAPLESLRGAMVAIADGAMVALVRSGIEAVAKLHDLSIQSHASAESLSAMRLSAEQTNTPIEAVAASIAKLNKSIGEARVVGGDKDGLFKTLGIDVRSGRDAADIMQDLARKLADMGDKQTADYVSSQLLGKSYSELAPFMANLVEKGTLVAEVSTKQADEANKLNDRIIALTHSMKLMLENENVVNRLNDIFDAIQKSNKESGAWAATLTGLRVALDLAFGEPISAIGKSEEAVGNLMNRIAIIQKNIEDYNNSGALGKFFGGEHYVERMQAELNAANTALKDAIDKRDALYKQQNADDPASSAGPDKSKAVIAAKAAAEAQKLAYEQGKVAAEQYSKWLDEEDKKEIERAKQEYQRHVQQIDALAAKNSSYFQGLRNQMQDMGKSQLQQDQNAQQRELQALAIQREIMATDHNLSLGEQQQFEEARLNIIALHQRQEFEMGKASGMNMLAMAGTQFRAFFELNKIARTADAVIAGYKAVQDSYAWGTTWGGPPGGAAMAAIALAATAANIMAIQSASFGGGTGASGAGGGGGGAPLTTPSPLAPQPTQAAAAPPPSVAVSISLDSGGIFSAAAVRGLIDQINQQIQDGAVISQIRTA